MGYNTRFELEASPILAPNPAEVIARFVDTNTEAEYCLTSGGATYQPGKWYEHESDLIALSKENPHLLFTLRGWGKENADVWVKYFHAGLMQVERAQMTIAGFDPAKLKKVGK